MTDDEFDDNIEISQELIDEILERGPAQKDDSERPWGHASTAQLSEHCFCGCGRAVRRTRRNWNDWGAGVVARLRSWDEFAPRDLFTDQQYRVAAHEMREAFLAQGTVMFYDAQNAVHGARGPGTYRRRDLRKWIKRSDTMLASVRERADG